VCRCCEVEEESFEERECYYRALRVCLFIHMGSLAGAARLLKHNADVLR